jgi:upstream activation factor subunit UAF30
MIDTAALRAAVAAEFAKVADYTTLSVKSFLATLSEQLGEDLAADKEVKAAIKLQLGELLAAMQDGDSDESDEDEEVIEDKPKKQGGFQKQLVLSEELAAFLNADTMARTEIVKQMWVYFKEKELQNPKDKREILLDEPLQKIFKVKKFTMFSMNKHITKHAWVPEVQDEYESSDEEMEEDEDGGEAPVKVKSEKKKTVAKKAKVAVKKEAGGKAKKEKDPNAKKPRQPMYHLSETLAAVVGTNELSRPQITKELWVYIRAKNLQNPSNKSQINCDEKLKKVMGGEEMVTMFSMNKYTSAHIGEKSGNLYDPN